MADSQRTQSRTRVMKETYAKPVAFGEEPDPIAQLDRKYKASAG